MKYYVVLKGKQTGIFTSRDECKSQVDGFLGAIYKSFTTEKAAQFALKEGSFGQKGQSSREYLRAVMGDDFDIAICTDAACPSNPGPVEYRGVEIATGKELFSLGPLAGGSVNLAEFLAIVEGMKIIENLKLKIKNGKRILYSDSKIAIGRTQKGSYHTTIIRTNQNKELFIKLDKAVQWLSDHRDWSRFVSLCKRPTDLRGQIPADFGRK